jgi:hypothetical protein
MHPQVGAASVRQKKNGHLHVPSASATNTNKSLVKLAETMQLDAINTPAFRLAMLALCQGAATFCAPCFHDDDYYYMPK